MRPSIPMKRSQGERTPVACMRCRKLKRRCVIVADDARRQCKSCILRQKDCQFLVSVGASALQDASADISYPPLVASTLPAGMITTMTPNIGTGTHASMAAVAANIQPLNFGALDTHIVQAEAPVWPMWGPMPTMSRAQEDMAATYPASDPFAESMAHGLRRRATDPVWPLTRGQVDPERPCPARLQGTPMLASGQSVGVGYPAWEMENVTPHNRFNAVKGEMSPSSSVSGYGTVERPWPSPPGYYTTWERVPTSFIIPFRHYAMLYLDHMGHLGVVESPSIQEHGTTFTSEAQKRFLEILERYEQGHRKSLVCAMITVPASFISQLRSSVLGVPTTSYRYSRPQDTTYDHQVKCVKASVDNSECGVSSEQETSQSFTEKALMIGDTTNIVAYYESGFKQLRQDNCRLIAKAFIKFIEPRKRAKHPYKSLKCLARDPQSTKPDWWPSDVPHVEPDHLLKDQRLRLLIHILRKLGGRGITSDKLQDVAGDYARQLLPEEEIGMKMKILNNIFKVRRLEEQYERQEIDANTCIYICNDDTSAIEFGGHEAPSEAKEEVASEELDDL